MGRWGQIIHPHDWRGNQKEITWTEDSARLELQRCQEEKRLGRMQVESAERGIMALLEALRAQGDSALADKLGQELCS
jgi:hypothetical protein